MEADKLKEMLALFNAQADSVKNKLTNLLVTVSDGRVPRKDELLLFNADMDTLVSEYDQLRKEAESILTADELPKDGSKAVEYVEAVANSRSCIIKHQLERAEGVLQRFLKVKSLIAEYETALSPFKEKAADVLKELSEDNIEKMLPDTEITELFLKALEIENINGPEGFEILGEINKHYPMQVQWGLAGGQYFIDESIEPAIRSEYTVKQEVEKAEEIIVKSIENGELHRNATFEEKKERILEEQSIEEANQVADEEITEPKTEEVVASVEEAEDDESVTQEDTLVSINKVKSGPPSASSFKKEIIKLAKNNKEIRDILPLMTNLGVLTREQVYLFGICMDCFEESDRDRERVDASINVLASKGYLACFEYKDEKTSREAYCLSTYCNGCLKKDSISGQMRGFWSLSFGGTNIVSSFDIEKSIVEKFVRNNDRLSEYFYAIKGLVEPDEYQIIKQSIKWMEDHYCVAVIMNGETTNCCLYDPDYFQKDIKEGGILVIGKETEVDDILKDKTKKIFVYDNQSITFLEEDTTIMNEVVNKESVDESEQTTEQVINKDNVTENKNTIKDVKLDSAMLEAETSMVFDDDIGDISFETIIKKPIPTDEEFCSVIMHLLNRETTTKEQLTSIIAQTIAFAKAVGDVKTKENGDTKDYEGSYKLSAQLRLASNLMLDECVYTSEFLSSVFSNPVNDDPAIMLSAYMFAMLVPGMAFDYGFKNQTELFLDHYEDYFGDFASFKPLFNKLMSVKDAAVTGFSPAFVSLLGDEAESEKFINELRTMAHECLTVKMGQSFFLCDTSVADPAA